MTVPASPPFRLDFIPGTLCDERMWTRLIPLLGNVDCRHVPLHKARTRVQMQELIAGHSAQKSHLVAFSLGAYLAVEYAVAHPGRIASLTLIANSAKGLQPAEIETRQRIAVMLERNAYTGITRQRLREILHPAHVHDASIVSLIDSMALDLGKDVLLTQFATTIDRLDLMDRLAELPFPVLIIGAEDDRLVPAADLREMAARFPHATLHMFGEQTGQQTGHMIPLEAPEALADAMLAFMAASPAAFQR